MPTSTINVQLKEIVAQTRQGLENLYGEQLIRIILYGSQAEVMLDRTPILIY